jgi:hypothetical protein
MVGRGGAEVVGWGEAGMEVPAVTPVATGEPVPFDP